MLFSQLRVRSLELNDVQAPVSADKSKVMLVELHEIAWSEANVLAAEDPVAAPYRLLYLEFRCSLGDGQVLEFFDPPAAVIDDRRLHSRLARRGGGETTGEAAGIPV